MKKRIAILSLIAIFAAATTMSAQTVPAKATKAKTEAKCDMKGDKKAACKDEKACCKDAKGAKKDAKACCEKKAEAKK
jgi:hypothetical protein